MSYRDTRIYVCDICGREEEGMLIRERMPDGALFFDLPAGWQWNHSSRRLCNCEDCVALISEVKRQAKESK